MYRIGFVPLAAVLACVPGVAAAHDKSVVLAYAGVLDLGANLDTRIYQGGFADIYTDDNVGFHADIVHVDREENATYFAGGISFALTDHVRPKIMVGSSTDNTAILPDIYASFGVQFKPGENSGWVLTPGVAYRHYRNGTEDTIGSFAVAKYFSVPWDHNGYYAAQASISTSLSATDRARVSATAGLQTVRKSGVGLGVTGEVGALVRDPVLGTNLRGRYFAVRPNLAVPLFPKVQLIARGEYAETELYTAQGGSTGIKVEF